MHGRAGVLHTYAVGNTPDHGHAVQSLRRGLLSGDFSLWRICFLSGLALGSLSLPGLLPNGFDTIPDTYTVSAQLAQLSGLFQAFLPQAVDRSTRNRFRRNPQGRLLFSGGESSTWRVVGWPWLVDWEWMHLWARNLWQRSPQQAEHGIHVSFSSDEYPRLAHIAQACPLYAIFAIPVLPS